MKKVMMALAVAGMFAFAACNNQKAEETTAPEPVAEENVEAPVAEEESVEGVAQDENASDCCEEAQAAAESTEECAK